MSAQAAGRAADLAHPDLPGEKTIAGWLRRNATFLLLLVAALGAGLLVSQLRTAYQQSRDRKAWELYGSLTSAPGAFEAAHVQETLDKARANPRVRGWILLAAAEDACRRADRQALALLRPELDLAVAEKWLAGLTLAVAGERQEILDHVRTVVEAELGGASRVPDFALPEPTGRKVRLAMAMNDGPPCDLVVGLYEEEAPEACRRFLDAVAASSLSKVEWSGFGLRFRGLEQGGTSASPLPLESRWGLFRRQGVLATFPAPGSTSGQQNGDEVYLLTRDDPAQDGRTTVFGKVVEGGDCLQAIVGVLPSPQNPTRSVPAFTLASAEILP